MDTNQLTEIQEILSEQRLYFTKGFTSSVAGRLARLKRLKAAIRLHTRAIEEALWEDLHKPSYETYATEIQIVLQEIDVFCRHLRRWAKPKRVSSPFFLFPSRSRILHEPYGLVLILSPWNYPFQLLMTPLVAAVAAGNVVAVKPAEDAPRMGEVIEMILREAFDERHVSVFQGDIEMSTRLLQQRFDYIFFTGSPWVGRIVMEAAIRHLTPITLELGGKSPCIVDETAHIPLAARRIIWGKMLNAGQTCVAPDYLLVHAAVREALVKEMIACLKTFYGEDARQSPDYPRLVSVKALDRLVSLLQGETILYGGAVERDERYLEPTLLEIKSPDSSPLMEEEIFGPVLPLIEINTIDEAIAYVNAHEKPLALYYFGKEETGRNVIARTSSGGACLNNTVLHLANPALPFGGIGESGMGSYHGRAGFDTFTHCRSVLVSATWFDLKMKYPPYKEKVKWLKRLM